jgi:hypothetical protein
LLTIRFYIDSMDVVPWWPLCWTIPAFLWEHQAKRKLKNSGNQGFGFFLKLWAPSAFPAEQWRNYLFHTKENVDYEIVLDSC